MIIKAEISLLPFPSYFLVVRSQIRVLPIYFFLKIYLDLKESKDRVLV